MDVVPDVLPAVKLIEAIPWLFVVAIALVAPNFPNWLPKVKIIGKSGTGRSFSSVT